MNKDALSGLVLIAIAGAYYWSSAQIADSTLSDEVGAGGLPRLLAYALACLGFVLLVRALAASRSAKIAAAGAEVAEEAGLPRAMGLLLLGGAYVLLLPFLGYVVSVTLLIAIIATYEGAQRRWTLPVVAAGGGLLYWAVFVKLLGVRHPTGTLWQSFLG